MFPGLTTRLSRGAIASTTVISPKTDIVYVTGTEAIATINPAFGGGFSGIVILIPEGAFTTVTTGNIAKTSTGVAGKALIMVYDNVKNKFYPSY